MLNEQCLYRPNRRLPERPFWLVYIESDREIASFKFYSYGKARRYALKIGEFPPSRKPHGFEVIR